MGENINVAVFSTIFCPGKSIHSRLEVVKEVFNVHNSANLAYTKKRGAGVKTFSLDAGAYIDCTPFQELLGILSRFSAESLPNDSKSSSNVRYLGTINRTITSVLRLLNDRLAMLWRGSPEDDPLGTFQNGLLLMHEIAKTCQAFISLQYHLKSLFQPGPQNRNSRIMSTRSYSSSLTLTGKLLLSRVQSLQQMTLPQFQTRIDHFLVSCTCQLVDISNAKNLKPASFRRCESYTYSNSNNIDFNGKVVSRCSVTTWGCIPCSIRVSKVFSGNNSSAAAAAREGSTSEVSNHSSKEIHSGSSMQSSFVRNKPLMSYYSGNMSALLALRLAALLPLYKASQTHCEHPQSMQAMSLCINAALEQFVAAATKDISVHGIDASGVVSLFSQVQELRAWVISIKQEMALPVLLQDITSWIRVDEIVSLLTGTYEEMSGRSSAVSSTHRGDGRGPHRRPTSFPRHVRRNNNGSIQSESAEDTRIGSGQSCVGLVVSPVKYAIGSVYSHTMSAASASYHFVVGFHRNKLSSIAPLPAAVAKQQTKERQINDLLSGRILLRDTRAEGNGADVGDDGADDVISGTAVAAMMPTANDCMNPTTSTSTSLARGVTSAASRSSRGNKTPTAFIQSHGLALSYSRVYIRDTVLWSEFGTILARKHAKVTQPPSSLTLIELKEWKARAKQVTELSTNWKDKYIKGCRSPRKDPVEQLKHIKIETWDM